jgi:hypothetical protein
MVAHGNGGQKRMKRAISPEASLLYGGEGDRRKEEPRGKKEERPR